MNTRPISKLLLTLVSVLFLFAADCNEPTPVEITLVVPDPATPAEPAEPFCGDGTCNPNETHDTCSTDCPADPVQEIEVTFSAIYRPDGSKSIAFQIENNRDLVLSVRWELYDIFKDRRNEANELTGAFSLALYPADQICSTWYVDLEILELKEGYSLAFDPEEQIILVGELEPACNVPEPRAIFQCFNDPDDDCNVLCDDKSTGDNLLDWLWLWGDGRRSTSQNPSHAYRASGTYNIELTVTDEIGKSDSVTNEITITSCP